MNDNTTVKNFNKNNNKTVKSGIVIWIGANLYML